MTVGQTDLSLRQLDALVNSGSWSDRRRMFRSCTEWDKGFFADVTTSWRLWRFRRELMREVDSAHLGNESASPFAPVAALHLEKIEVVRDLCGEMETEWGLLGAARTLLVRVEHALRIDLPVYSVAGALRLDPVEVREFAEQKRWLDPLPQSE